jgi:hypothetical protein
MTTLPCLERDHFKCYHTLQIGFPRFERREVTTDDQFGSAVTSVRRPWRLCNPVDKNGEGIDEPASHLMCYQADDAGIFERRYVQVQNQFGEQQLSVIRTESLCLPAEKDGVPRPPGSALDHFKCYRVHRRHGTPDFQPRTVTLADQFEDKTVTVIKPLLLCNPVDKAGEGVRDPTCHLTCYKIKQDSFEPRVATVVDQFTEATLDALTGQCRKVAVLCVPSLKQEID